MKDSLVRPFKGNREPRICLVNYTGQYGDRVAYFPLGVALVSAALKEAKHYVTVADLDTALDTADIDALDERVIDRYIVSSDVVGFSARGGTSLGLILDWIEQVKNTTDKIVIVGGALVTAEPKRFLQETSADFIVAGEGEEAIVKLMAAFKEDSEEEIFDKLTSIAGIGYRHKNEIIFNAPVAIQDLDTIPIPDYNSFGIDKYTTYRFAYTDLGDRNITMFTSRGCPFNCQFCTHVFGRKWRGHSAERIFSDVKYLSEKYGITGFNFQDDNFMYSKKRVREVCTYLKTLHVKWSCEARATSLDDEIVQVMKDAGCVSIRLGLESGSDRILKLMRKGVTAEANRRAVDCLVRNKMPIVAGFMFGVPDENMDDAKETLKFIRHIHKTASVSKIWSYFYTPRPSNPWYWLAVEKGMKEFTLRDWARLDKYSGGIFNLSELTEGQIKRLMFKVNLSTFLANKGKARVLLNKRRMLSGLKYAKALILRR